ncbi:methyltransferase domain-containing protein [Streptomyces sp. UNOC14_S4]|uniref:methyltransferase domain-containing protein n=1 Tax=Streptomyces sp. UNOC14_S4 TaxID=2872340 RepID=UPI001E45C11D|nr:methyltransferase domain-containing protein [Streptomyces sp. UNOC14_S4]MCC3767197.1 methyltransferase domain-containing protein [Streptomyces sp. UNOC14_S4]
MTSTTDRASAQSLADALTAEGQLTAPWREAYDAVPREHFVPEVAWAVPDGPAPGYAIDRNRNATGWWNAVHSDASIVTQFDDGRSDVRRGRGVPTVSCSAPGIVFSTFAALDVHDHHRVLEIGTGTGWTASLLSHRVGERNVVSVEVDEQAAAQAKKNVKAAGYAPCLITGDGSDGWLDGAPYDRVHVTCAVERLPYTWVAQARPGGIIVAPWAPPFAQGQLVRFIVDAEGRAVGRLVRTASYMMLRSQRYALKWNPRHPQDAHQERTRLDPRAVAECPLGAGLAITALAPGVAKILAPDLTDSGRCSLLLVETGEGIGAWAAVDYVPGDPDYQVTWHGPRNLWQEVSDAYLRWISWGQPDGERFGLTIDEGGQELWLDRPDCVIRSTNAGDVRARRYHAG